MDWKQVFESVASTIGTASVIVAALAFVGKAAVKNFFQAGLEELKANLKKQNELELAKTKHQFELALAKEKERADIEKETLLRSLDNEATINERIRREILAWANPILNSVLDLKGRLTNILENKGYEALDESSAPPNPNWSISYSYFVNSTMYLFGQYFCWVQMLQQELSFEIFRSHELKDRLFASIRDVSDALGNYPPEFDGAGNDTQVFRLQQRAIADTLASSRDTKRACLGYAEFLSKYSAELQSLCEPVKMLVDKVKPGERRWNRLRAVHSALLTLEKECEALLKLDDRPSTTPA
jgi:hypothetical protein